MHDWKWAAQTESPGRNFQARRGLPSFVFVSVNFAGDRTDQTQFRSHIDWQFPRDFSHLQYRLSVSDPRLRTVAGNPDRFDSGEARRMAAFRLKPGNQFPFAIDQFCQGVDHCFGDVGEHGQAACHVAVESAIPYRHFRFVSSAEDHGSELVRYRHQEIPANTSLKIFLGHVFGAPAESFIKSGFVGIKYICN